MNNNNRAPKHFYYIADLSENFRFDEGQGEGMLGIGPDAEAVREVWMIRSQLACAQQLCMISASLARMAEVMEDAFEKKATVQGG